MEIEIKSINFENVTIEKEPAILTGNKTFDNWYSRNGGLVRRSVTYFTGESGGGKTTLMLNLMKWLGSCGIKSSMYSREMYKDDVREQTSNLKIESGNAFIADFKTHPTVNDYMYELDILKPSVVIVDSLQVIAQEDYPEMSEEQSTVAVLKRLIQWARDKDACLIVIGHQNKNGTYNGVCTLKHLVDGLIQLCIDKKTGARQIQWIKNRKGEVGRELYFSFGEDGIKLYTEQEWNSQKYADRNFADYISSATSTYIKTLDKTNPNCEAFKKQYEQGIKKLQRTSSTQLEFYGNVIKMVVELSAIYKM